MYKIVLTLKALGQTLELSTSTRSIARSLTLLADENSDEISVTVTKEVQAREVKFKGVSKPVSPTPKPAPKSPKK